MLNDMERVIALGLAALALIVPVRAFYRRFNLIRFGRNNPSGAPEALEQRLKRFFLYVPGQWGNLRNVTKSDLAGLQHLFIFWPVVVLSLNYLIFLFIGELFGITDFLRENIAVRALLVVSDLMAFFLVAALTSGLVRRGLLKPARLGPDFETGTFSLTCLSG